MASWSELLEKWFRDTISESELQEMQEQARGCPWKQEDLDTMSDADKFAVKLRESYAIDTEASWKKFARGKWPKNSHI